MSKEEKYYKCEYERLRRKSKKEIETLKIKQCEFLERTYQLLKEIGMSDKAILSWYEHERLD